MTRRSRLLFWRWVLEYRREDLPGDILAGLTVALMLVPQSMAYAQLAGLPPVMGLYTGILPVLIYGLLGSTRVLTLGPTAITSVLILNSLQPLATQGTDAYLMLSLTLTLTLGIVFLLMGLLRLGFLVNLLSQPVLVAYVNAAALIIVFSQIQHLAGIHVERTAQPFAMLLEPLRQLQTLNGTTLLIGLGSLVLILLVRHRLDRLLLRLHLPEVLRFTITRSGPLLVVVLTTLLVALLRLDETQAVNVVGAIPSGLPRLGLGSLDLGHMDSITLGALAIAFVGFMEGISTAKSLASPRQQHINPNQELIAMGAANLASTFSGGFAATTSISRSAVNTTAGAGTGLSSIIAALLVAGVALFLTPLLYYLPDAALAAIILSSVINLIDFRSIRQLWRFSRAETIPFFVTFLVVFFYRIEIGILLGVGLSVLLHLSRTMRPAIVRLGREDYSEYYREAQRPAAAPVPGVLILRVDESLYFANAQHLDRQLRNQVADYDGLEYLILVGSAINRIDGTALQILAELIHDLHEAGIEVYISELSSALRKQIALASFIREIGAARFFDRTHDAVVATGKLPDDQLPI